VKSERLNLIDWEAGFGLPGQSGKLALTVKSGKLASARLEVYLDDNFKQLEPLDGLWNIGARRALMFEICTIKANNTLEGFGR